MQFWAQKGRHIESLSQLAPRLFRIDSSSIELAK